MPAIHLSRQEVADLFTRVTGEKQEPDIGKLVKVSRKKLRQDFLTADMGISGANFGVTYMVWGFSPARLLTNGTIRNYIQTGEIGELGNTYQTNRLNGPVSFYRNPVALGTNMVTNYSNASYNAFQIDRSRRRSACVGG